MLAISKQNFTIAGFFMKYGADPNQFHDQFDRFLYSYPNDDHATWFGGNLAAKGATFLGVAKLDLSLKF
jgi:hypothetical protein